VELRDWSRLYCADARVRSAQGDWKGALRSIERAATIGRHAGEDPVLIGVLVHNSIEASAYQTLVKLIERESSNAAFASAARKTLERFGPLPDFRRSLMGEVVLGRMMIRGLEGRSSISLGENEEPKPPTAIERAFFQSPTVQSAFDSKLVGEYRALIERIPKDPGQWEQAVAISREHVKRIENDKSIANVLNRILFPVLDRTAEAVGQTQTHRRLAETALRLVEERAKAGAFPRLLPDYGSIRIDPYTGKPFRYRREGNGILLYSFGRDRVDDDGVVRNPRESSQTFDEAIRIK
jgi:hypothetical protein